MSYGIAGPRWVNSLAPGRCKIHAANLFLKSILQIEILIISCEIGFIWIPETPIDEK